MMAQLRLQSSRACTNVCRLMMAAQYSCTGPPPLAPAAPSFMRPLSCASLCAAASRSPANVSQEGLLSPVLWQRSDAQLACARKGSLRSMRPLKPSHAVAAASSALLVLSLSWLMSSSMAWLICLAQSHTISSILLGSLWQGSLLHPSRMLPLRHVHARKTSSRWHTRILWTLTSVLQP